MCADGPVFSYAQIGDLMEWRAVTQPRRAVFKMASCDGCQLQLLDAEEALLDLAGAIEIANFAEATSREGSGSLRRHARGGLGFYARADRPGEGDPGRRPS